MATITVTELASTLEANPREVRKFLRSITPDDEQPGKGGRWAIEKRQVRSLATKFTAWQAERTPAVDDASDAPEAAEEIEGTSD